MDRSGWNKGEVNKSRPAGMPVAKRGELYHAIRDKCLDCMGHEEAVRRIRDCDAQGEEPRRGDYCPLHSFRPYQEGG